MRSEETVSAKLTTVAADDDQVIVSFRRVRASSISHKCLEIGDVVEEEYALLERVVDATRTTEQSIQELCQTFS